MNNTLSAPLSSAEQQAFQKALLSFLAAHTARYTSGDSTSVPAETAEALFSSICFCLRLFPEDYKRQRFLLRHGIDPAFRKGLLAVEKRRDDGRQLWQAVCCQPLPVENVFLTDTLQNIGLFWKRYDPRYFACEIPCSIDYPLAIPASESLHGIDYVNLYLRHLAIETDFLCHFTRNTLVSVLNRASPEYRELPLNLFEPVAVNALGRGLLNGSADTLFISPEERDFLRGRFSEASRAELGTALQSSAGLLATALNSSAGQRAYLRSFSAQLLPRLTAAFKNGGLDGIFFSE